MKKNIILLFILVCQFAFAQHAVRTLSDVLARSYLNNNPGALVIGIYNNDQQHLFYYGETEAGNGLLPDSSSIFEIGNITETFTDILYAHCTLKGIMHMDDILQKYLPVNVPSLVYQPVVCKPVERKDNFGYNDEPGMHVQFTPYICLPDSSYKPQPILLCYLGTHTSGLPDWPSNLKKTNKNNPYADYTEEDLYNFLREYNIQDPIGFEYKHSSLGISLLGKAVSLKLKKDYSTALIENILDSLKMFDTRINLSERQNKRLIQGYYKGKKAEHWTYDVLAPSGALHSTPADMMKFLAKNISKEKDYYSNLLDYTHNSRLKPGGIFSNDLEIALGWKIIPVNNENPAKIVMQNGLTGGFSSFIGFVETSHTGVVILSSVSNDVNEMGIQILNLLQKEN